ncbi:MAG TPA: DUF2092 domain-containing protein [Armatimonadota bacterium]|nr:DUF2092 domain-containing protein [Armatimonadota bacterium]
MRKNRTLMCLFVLCVALTISSHCIAARQQPASFPEAKAWLKKTSDYLGTLNRFQVHVQTSREIIYPRGGRIDDNAYGDVFVQRPNMLRVNVFRANKIREIYYNGTTLTVFSPKLNYYGEIAAPPTIDQMLTMARRDYGISLPATDLLRTNLYSKVAPQITTGIVVGSSLLNGVYCKQLAFRSGTMDWQVWIENSSTPVPIQIVIVDRGVKGNPRYTARFTEWNTNPTFDTSMFTFTPPQGALKIRFVKPSQVVRAQNSRGGQSCPTCR